MGVLAVVPLGLLFGSWLVRTRRLWPLIVAHAILDFTRLAAGAGDARDHEPRAREDKECALRARYCSAKKFRSAASYRAGSCRNAKWLTWGKIRSPLPGIWSAINSVLARSIASS